MSAEESVIDHPKEHLKLIEESRFMKFKLDKLQVNMDLLRQQLQVERVQNRELKNEKANFISERSQLEEFFLECVDEVKKEISKRKDIQSNSKFSHKSTKNSISSLPTLKSRFSQFTSSDKQQVIEMLFQNDSVLLFLYEKLFPVTSLQSMQPQRNLQSAKIMQAGSQLSLLQSEGL